MRRNTVWLTLTILTMALLGCITIEVFPGEETPMSTLVAFPTATWTVVWSDVPTALPTHTTPPAATSESRIMPSVGQVLFASGVTGGSQPVDVATEFPDGTSRVYVFATYTGMTDGLRCESVWSADGQEVARTSFEWALGRSGETWLDMMEADGGLAPGVYEWELLAEGGPLVQGSFTVGATAVGTPQPEPTRTQEQGPRIVFVSLRDRNNEIYIMNDDGTDVVRLTNNSDIDYDPSCSPDGKRIAFMSRRDGNNEIYVMNSDGTGVTRLTNNGAEDWDPAWSADARHIAFVSDRDGNAEIYIMDADGGAVTRVTENSLGDRWPSWSPDGNRIVLTSPRNGNDELLIKDLVSGGMTRLTTNQADDWDPTWSPDGTRIAFVSNRTGNDEIYVMDAAGGGVTRLTSNPAVNISPAWSPDGRRLAFGSYTGTNGEIYVMNADGSGVIRLTSNPADDWDPSWCGT
jgi:tricorn protease-like protein